MIATVKAINPVYVLVRRNHRQELIQIPNKLKTPELYELYNNLRVGDRVEVKRVTNNPYPNLVGMEQK